MKKQNSHQGEGDGSDTSYVNFVRSYHGSSSRSSLTNNGKPQQAWEGKIYELCTLKETRRVKDLVISRGDPVLSR